MYLRLACGIELEGKMVVTGGFDYDSTLTLRTVAQFTETGAVKFFARLKTSRFAHACSKFVNDKGDTVREGYKVRIESLEITTQWSSPDTRKITFEKK